VTGLLPTGPHDLIFSCGSLHYVTRDRRADLFARLRGMTRPGGHQAHLVFTDDLVHEEKGEIVEYYRAGELHEAFVSWKILERADHVISCAQDGTAHGHAVEEIVAARPVGPAPGRSEP
jgi:cyclopropane fatty-acyl-phospholipid synthase-like methyltransferase